MHSLYCGFAMLGMMLAASCPPSVTPIAVPRTNPGTRPDVVLDVHFPQGPILTVTPSGNIPVVPTQLNGNDEISLVATCTDNTSGCRNIEIFADATTINVDNSVGTAPPPGAAVAQNPDSAALPGGTANAKRTANIKLSVPQLRGTFAGLQLDVSARATNAHGESWNTRKVSLFWSQKPALTLPNCPRFFGSVRAVVLDSRNVTIGIQNAKAANPARTTFVVGMEDPATTTHVWRLDIEETALPRTSATFKLVDQTGAEVDLLSIDSRSCSAAGALVRAPRNSSSPEFTFTAAGTTTIVLRGPNHGILASGMHDDAVFNEATFWPAFGGKKTTITWLK